MQLVPLHPGPNPLLFAAQQPLPSLDSQETQVADRTPQRYGSVHSSDVDSPPSAPPFSAHGTPPSPPSPDEAGRRHKYPQVE
jgi:hypothetical protein